MLILLRSIIFISFLMIHTTGQPSACNNNSITGYLFDYPGSQVTRIHVSMLSDTAMFVFRLLACFVLSVIMLELVGHFPSIFTLVEFLSFIGFSLTWLYFWLVCLHWLITRNSHLLSSPGLEDWISLVFEVVWCLEFPITIIFWSLLYHPAPYHTSIALISDIGVHGFPLFCLLIDFIFNIYHFPYRHLFVVAGFSSLYAFFNFVYSRQVSPVYGPINWISIKSYGWIASAFLILIAVYLLSHLICRKFKQLPLQDQQKYTELQVNGAEDHRNQNNL